MFKENYISAFFLFVCFSFLGCGKKSSGGSPQPPPTPAALILRSWSVNENISKSEYTNVSTSVPVKLVFSSPVNRSTVVDNIVLSTLGGAVQNHGVTYQSNDSVLIIIPSQSLSYLTKYKLTIRTGLKSISGGALNTTTEFSLYTALDPSDKFPRISDDELLTLVQRQTFKYFWDFAHPVSGLARERNTSGDLVTSGGSGFGIMSIVTGIHRQFISRVEGLQRMQKIVDFLKNKAQTFHGAFPHWLNGGTGTVIPFSANDDGADLVETSYLVQGLLTARQYFDGGDATETALRNDINVIWKRVEWNWFRRGSENVLYWHWSSSKEWIMNFPIRGWNESLITYALAASSPDYSIPKSVYDQGWAQNGAIKNGASYYGISLPLGPPNGGPLFFAHYSFLGINPNSLTDAYANYLLQNTAHTLINYKYCIANPKGWYGYSDSCWGLTASDNQNGYSAHEPNNDLGVITPTAALSSFPYTPAESMKALKFFYYKLGDKIWKEYGFVDAFNLNIPWFANSFLAIDQGPIIIMIENHRSGLLWNLFTSAPEVKAGMRSLGFTAPYL